MALLASCTGDQALSPSAAFTRAELLFQHGELAASQDTSAWLADHYGATHPEWSAKFQVLQAESASWRGMSPVVLRVLAVEPPPSTDIDLRIRRLYLLAYANTKLHRFEEAQRYLGSADDLCPSMAQAVCSEVLHAHWALAMERGDYDEASRFSSQEIATTHRFGRRFDEAAALTNRAFTSLQQEHFDEAIDWMDASNRIATPLAAGEILLINTGNLGWAYYRLGDKERALNLFQDAERRAKALGATLDTINWLTTGGIVYQDMQEWGRAESSYRQALDLARNINSSEDIIDCLENLAYVSIDADKLNDAENYLGQLDSLLGPNGNRLDALDVMLARGRIAVARHENSQAEAIFRAVENDPASQISMRLGAEHELARLYETEERTNDARKMYATALGTFESERAALKNEDSKLPFFANATPIYDDYIDFLMRQGRSGEALATADQSRARTLAQGLGLTGSSTFTPASFRPGSVAGKTGATLLFYWLGAKQSWLWAITPEKTAAFPLPAEAEIGRAVERYRRALLGPEDPLEAADENGIALYRMLVQPAGNLLRPGAKVVVLSDGKLSELNFETLIVPGPEPHYWIEDANVISAPSLSMLASAKAPRTAGRSLLLLGNALSPGPDYPDLPNAATEMQHIRQHFAAKDEAVLDGGRATAAAYLASAPQQYSYIDFVAHGIASETDPLDSAIILSRNGGTEDSFRLYAREIIRHPIDAQLVTISACYGGGTRSYAGEGLVGLSWAFLRAGAHNVIGALWEVSDDSTPRLMDSLYQGLEDGLPPGAALRQAKLSLLHSQGDFRRPFFWGPFQIYTGL